MIIVYHFKSWWKCNQWCSEVDGGWWRWSWLSDFNRIADEDLGQEKEEESEDEAEEASVYKPDSRL